MPPFWGGILASGIEGYGKPMSTVPRTASPHNIPKALHGPCEECGVHAVLFVARNHKTICDACKVTRDLRLLHAGVYLGHAPGQQRWIVVCTRCQVAKDWRFQDEYSARILRDEHEQAHRVLGRGFVMHAAGHQEGS